MSVIVLPLHPPLLDPNGGAHPQTVANTNIVLGWVRTNLKGEGAVELIVPGHDHIRALFEAPAPDGSPPFTREAIDHLRRTAPGVFIGQPEG